MENAGDPPNYCGSFKTTLGEEGKKCAWVKDGKLQMLQLITNSSGNGFIPQMACDAPFKAEGTSAGVCKLFLFGNELGFVATRLTPKK